VSEARSQGWKIGLKKEIGLENLGFKGFLKKPKISKVQISGF